MAEGFVVWFTGSEGSGKTDMAEVLEGIMLERGMDVELFTEEIFREDFVSDDDPSDTVIKRAVNLAKVLSRNNVPAIFALNAPKMEIRNFAREEIGNFVEVFCEGEADGFEAPGKTEVSINTDADEEENAELILRTIGILGYLPDGSAESSYSEEEEEKIKKRLADLGYI